MQVIDGAVDIEEGNLRFDHLHFVRKKPICVSKIWTVYNKKLLITTI